MGGGEQGMGEWRARDGAREWRARDGGVESKGWGSGEGMGEWRARDGGVGSKGWGVESKGRGVESKGWGKQETGNRKYLFVPKTTKQSIQHKNHTIYYIYVDMIKRSSKSIEYGLKNKR